VLHLAVRQSVEVGAARFVGSLEQLGDEFGARLGRLVLRRAVQLGLLAASSNGIELCLARCVGVWLERERASAGCFRRGKRQSETGGRKEAPHTEKHRQEDDYNLGELKPVAQRRPGCPGIWHAGCQCLAAGSAEAVVARHCTTANWRLARLVPSQQIKFTSTSDWQVGSMDDLVSSECD
jgi:hypothetical protein